MITSIAQWLLSFNWLSGMGMTPAWWIGLVITGLGIFIFIAINALVLVYVERKVSAFMQVRVGPMRVGPMGLLQTVADTVKLVVKEDIIPAMADKALFRIGPFLVLMISVMAWAAIPFSHRILAAEMDIGLFYVVSVSSIVVLGIVMSGWASNNKWSLYGSMRSAAQMISYEIPVALSLLTVVAVVGSLNLQTIIQSQAGTGALFHWIPLGLPNWYVFHSPFLMLAALIYFIGGTAEVNRVPFDIPESESELVAGYMTEFSGLRWALFFLSEYANAALVGFITVIMFFGGWQSPFADYRGAQIGLSIFTVIALVWTLYVWMRVKRWSIYPLGVAAILAVFAWLFPGFAIWLSSPGFFWMTFKVFLMVFLMMWIRWTFPRLRVDQLMYVSWKVLLPAALLNLMGVAIWLWITGAIQF